MPGPLYVEQEGSVESYVGVCIAGAEVILGLLFCAGLLVVFLIGLRFFSPVVLVRLVPPLGQRMSGTLLVLASVVILVSCVLWPRVSPICKWL